MNEKRKNIPEGEIKDEELDAVTGGIKVHFEKADLTWGELKCTFCNNKVTPIQCSGGRLKCPKCGSPLN